MRWRDIERPGYFGKKRDELSMLWDQQFGEGNWRLAWEFGNIYLEKIPALEMVYTTAYYEHLKNDRQARNFLKKWRDVYDTAESNVESGLDFRAQETPNNHYHDIAVRRAMAMLGCAFRGKELLHIRWKDSLGYEYNPAMIPFHKPRLISEDKIKDYGEKGFWWEKGIERSVEEWYQRNKVLQVLGD